MAKSDDGEQEGPKGFAAVLKKLPFAAIGTAIAGFFSSLRERFTRDTGIGAIVKRIRESTRAQIAALIAIVVLFLLLLIILIAALSAAVTAGQIQDRVAGDKQKAAESNERTAAEAEASALAQAHRIPWLEQAILPDERDFFLMGEWGTDRSPQQFWSLKDALMYWQDFKGIYGKQLRDYNSKRFEKILENDL